MRIFNAKEFSSHFTPKPRPSAYLRPAVITAVNPAKGTVNIEWLDHPGVRQDVLLTPSGQGIFELPTIGSTVLVGFDRGFSVYILAYIPVGYGDLVGTSKVNAAGNMVQPTPSMLKLAPGEKMLISYLAKSEENQNNQFASPSPTGTYFHMSNVGDILMKTADSDYWRLDRRSNIIQQNSMNYRAITEAGILDFGLVKRLPSGEAGSEKQTEDIISVAGAPIGGGDGDSENALTEFRLRVVETADAESTTAPEIDDPLIEFTLGTKVTDTKIDADGKVTDVCEIVKTDDTYAETSDNAPKEIIIQLKTKADQGFKFTVDKEGNLTVNVDGNVKFDITGNSVVNVGGNADITVTNDVQVNAINMVFHAEDIKIAGNAEEQPVVLQTFLSDYYNTHTHIGNMGAPTGVPMVSSPMTKGEDISDITEVG